MVHYDPYMPEIKQDPHPIYRRMRAERPVYYVERFNAWALALFDDIWEASTDAEHYSVRNSVSDRDFLEGKPAPFESLPSMDPPAHDELRKRLFPHFSPRAARALEPRIRQWVTDRLDDHGKRGRIDAVSELAQPVAVRVACAINGFPMRDADKLVELVSRFFRREEGTEGMTADGRLAQREIWDYMAGFASERLDGADSRGDVLGKLVQERERWGDGSTLERISQHLAILLIAATDTFPKVFAKALLRLWQHPNQRRELCEDPSLIQSALTEVLRYDMPTQWLGRTVVKDHEVRGQPLRVGQPVLFLYPSANRDEREFDDPDVFDIHRNPPRILSFGNGIHRCLGSFMARMEGKVLLEEVLSRFPDYEVLEDEAVFPPTEFVQGYSYFPIAW